MKYYYIVKEIYIQGFLELNFLIYRKSRNYCTLPLSKNGVGGAIIMQF